MSNKRIQDALEYIQRVGQMPEEELQQRIKQIVPEDFVQFLYGYGELVKNNTPHAVQSLMLLGYMVRVNEEQAGLNVFTQKGARA